MDIVGRTASAAGLRNHQRRFMQIIFATVQLVHHLSDDQQRRITGIVMYALQPLIHNLRIGRGHQNNIVSCFLHDLLDKLEMDRQHLRNQNGIFPPHFFCKQQPSVLIINKLRHNKTPFPKTYFACLVPTASIRLRRRIFAAPRLLISSILIWV